MEIDKATRHAKITGNFGESIILYLLSKHGFESANVDHTGIDIISRNKKTGELMGISVKARSKTEKAKGSYIGVPNKHFKKVDEACKAFGCIPYFAFVSDEVDKIHIFILSQEELLKIHPQRESISTWTMSEKAVEEYQKNPKIISFVFDYKNINWW
ncbi:MAG: hypothetical protein NTW35_03875 [Candidatus Nomurabacteria bacterium]|nr:hypothetical protein [Candidatus Nomurabacteria bacterium]